MPRPAPDRESARSEAGGLDRIVLAGVVSLIAYVAIAVLSRHFTHGTDTESRPILLVLALLLLAFVWYLIALRTAVRIPAGRPLMTVIVVGSVVFRLALLLSTPIQEVDFYRYLWDGEVVAHGENPYAFTPLQVLDAEDNDEVPAELRRHVAIRDSSPATTTILTRVHYEQLSTVYPPVSQFVFALSAWLSPASASLAARLIVLKLIFLVFDLGVLLLLMVLLRLLRYPVGWSLAYGWCPLVLKEIANGSHLDVVAVFLTMAAFWVLIRGLILEGRGNVLVAGVLGGALLGLAIGAKLYPVIFVPLLALLWLRRLGWEHLLLAAGTCTLVTVVTMFPMMRELSLRDPGAGATAQKSDNGLTAFLSRWEMNDLLFMVLYENLEPDREDGSAVQPWFVVIPDPVRRSIVAAPKKWFDISASSAAFLLTRIVTTVVWLAIAAVLAWRASGCRDAMRWLRAAFLTVAWFWLLLPTQNPWYWLWAMPLLPFAGSRLWQLLSGLVLIYYLRFWLVYQWPSTEVPGLCYSGKAAFDYVLVWLEFGPWLLFLGATVVLRRYRAKRLVADPQTEERLP